MSPSSSSLSLSICSSCSAEGYKEQSSPTSSPLLLLLAVPSSASQGSWTCSPCYNVIDVIPYTYFGFQSFPLPSAGVKTKRSTSKLQTNYKPLNTGKIANFENCGINLEQEKHSPTHHRRKQCSQKFDELILSNLPNTKP